MADALDTIKRCLRDGDRQYEQLLRRHPCTGPACAAFIKQFRWRSHLHDLLAVLQRTERNAGHLGCWTAGASCIQGVPNARRQFIFANPVATWTLTIRIAALDTHK